MSEVDDILERLAKAGDDPRIQTMDDAVLTGLAAYRTRETARRSLALSGVAALGIGLASSLAFPQHREADPTLALIGTPASAPSNLLLGAK